MSAVLGISAQYHDAAAALVVDGRIVAAVHEERLSRRKNDPGLPLAAARACIELGRAAGVDGAGALDEIVFYEDPYARLEHVLVHTLRTFPRSLTLFPSAMRAQLGDKLWVLDELALGLNVERGRVTYRSHHQSHAASAFLPSPFESAAVLVVDGVGEDTSTSVWHGTGRDLVLVERIEHPHSLGLLYAALTAWLGFTVLEGEQKVMGLAAFGRPRFVDDVRKLIRVDAGDASFTLDGSYFAHHTSTELGFGPKLEALLGPRRPPGQPWRIPEDPADQRYADVASSLQLVVEDALVALAKRALASTNAPALCLAGGVALNACANARIASATRVPLFVQPAAGDAGGALGCALLASLARGDARCAPLESAALGVDVDAAGAVDVAHALGLRVSRVGDGVGAVAERISRGAVVAVANGRCEWGPRALGNRSLLAPTAPVDVKHTLNGVIKRREAFRPFAPAVRADDAQARFDVDPKCAQLTRFMTTTCAVKEHAKGALAAALHVDGTARLQTTSPQSAPFLHELLGRVAGGAVLNTSLNGRREPICGTGSDAVAFFAAHSGVDALLVGDDALIERGS